MLSVTILAISRTASKSPLEAIGKPASITSTPISSRILASSSFSSNDIEAPGDCSPSRMVVSKMMTRFLSAADTGVGRLSEVIGISVSSQGLAWASGGGLIP